MLDVDGFEEVNDTLGHEAGDRLLEALAPRLRNAVRAGDTVGRFGGDELVVLCEELEGAEAALELAERIRAAFADPFVLDERPCALAPSIGVALATGTARREAGELLREADAAMYRAKERGRDRVELFALVPVALASARAELEQALAGALARDELRVVCQPIVSLDDGAVAGFEGARALGAPAAPPRPAGGARAGQLDQVRRLRCAGAQGYAFARPLPADEAARLLADHSRRR